MSSEYNRVYIVNKSKIVHLLYLSSKLHHLSVNR